ncbi:hypothetical protein PENTCL1PPCAC_16020, partial [Pristionchus entomophagus]
LVSCLAQGQVGSQMDRPFSPPSRPSIYHPNQAPNGPRRDEQSGRFQGGIRETAAGARHAQEDTRPPRERDWRRSGAPGPDGFSSHVCQSLDAPPPLAVERSWTTPRPSARCRWRIYWRHWERRGHSPGTRYSIQGERRRERVDFGAPSLYLLIPLQSTDLSTAFNTNFEKSRRSHLDTRRLLQRPSTVSPFFVLRTSDASPHSIPSTPTSPFSSPLSPPSSPLSPPPLQTIRKSILLPFRIVTMPFTPPPHLSIPLSCSSLGFLFYLCAIVAGPSIPSHLVSPTVSFAHYRNPILESLLTFTGGGR